MKKIVLLVIFLSLSLPCSAHTFTLNADGTGDYPTIQAAVDHARNGDEIVLTPGTYKGDGNRDIDYKGAAITVRSTDPNDPSVVSTTIIDCNGSETEPHRGFYFNWEEGPESFLNGLTIINGYATGDWPQGNGGAIYCDNSDPTITNCLFRNNLADRYGGAIYCTRSNSLIVNCTFEKNWAGSRAGGLYSAYGDPTLISCVFRNNSTEGQGGGMRYFDTSGQGNPTLINCTFEQNRATNGGGFGSEFECNPTLVNCTFNSNAANNGGGIYSASNLVLMNCTFSRNTAIDHGGALYTLINKTAATNCTFRANSSGQLGGAVCSYGLNGPMLKNCLFSANSAENAGGCMFTENSTPVLANCTFASNLAHDGNALACDSYRHRGPSNLRVTNCIFRDGGNEIWNNDGSNIAVTYTNLENGWPGIGNVDADPYFVAPGYWDPNGTIDDANDDFWIYGDYHLLPDSPCIDTGDPCHPYDPNETDLDDNPRIMDGRIDMGAYEYIPHIQARLNITPKRLNCSSRGKWLKMRITLPGEIEPEQLENPVPLYIDWPFPHALIPTYAPIVSRGKNPVTIELEFDRQSILYAFGCLHCEPENIEYIEYEISVSGSLNNGRIFVATDTIKILNKN